MPKHSIRILTMRTWTLLLFVIFALCVQLSMEGIINVSHKKPIKIKIQTKPVLIKKPLPLLLLKKPLSLLFLWRHHHRSHLRKGWPVSAFFTLKAVKYAKVSHNRDFCHHGIDLWNLVNLPHLIFLGH